VVQSQAGARYVEGESDAYDGQIKDLPKAGFGQLAEAVVCNQIRPSSSIDDCGVLHRREDDEDDVPEEECDLSTTSQPAETNRSGSLSANSHDCRGDRVPAGVWVTG